LPFGYYVIHALRRVTSYARNILDLVIFLERRKITQSEGEWIQNDNGIYKGTDYVMQPLKENEKKKLSKKQQQQQQNKTKPKCSLIYLSKRLKSLQKYIYHYLHS